jgi:hypothetical protein
MEADRESFVAECYWPDFDDGDLAVLDRRIDGAIAELAADSVRYLGSILLREDEVLLCRFEGAADDVRGVAERAEIPFDRILSTAYSPRPISQQGGQE